MWLDNLRHNRKPNAADPYWYRWFRTNFPDWFRTISAAMGIDEQRSGTARPTRWPRDAGPTDSWPRLCNRCPPTDQLKTGENPIQQNQQLVTQERNWQLCNYVRPTRIIRSCKSFSNVGKLNLLAILIFYFLFQKLIIWYRQAYT